MSPLTYNIVTLSLYLAVWAYLLTLLIKQRSLQQWGLLAFTIVAVVLHGLGLYELIILPASIDLGITKVFSLVMFSVNCIVLISSLRKPLHNLFVLLFPLSSIAVVLSLLPTTEQPIVSNLGLGMGAHVLLSIIAYSLLFMAVLQAVLLYWQNHQLKKRRLSPLINYLPPLQTMESLLFELLWVGVILLAGGIIVGAFYIEDMFAQHLAHQTILSIIAWFIFATLLWGRIQWGWRGNQAIRWVLVGFCVLMLAYFGSKLVLEVIMV
jgi:ABC-type uncharacterized transport system permease subunit